MNIFETKSKYFHNNNSWFATKFGSIAIAVVIMFIGLVIVYKSTQGFFMNKLEKNLNKAVTEYFTGNFQAKGLALWTSIEDPTGEHIIFQYGCKELTHPKLNEGVTVRYGVTILVYLDKTSDDSIVIDHVGIKYTEEGTWRMFTIDNWYDYLLDPENNITWE